MLKALTQSLLRQNSNKYPTDRLREAMDSTTTWTTRKGLREGKAQGKHIIS